MKNKKLVTKKDLKGDLSGFPLEVVQWMCDQQVEQGNEFDVEVFQKDCKTSSIYGGFTWSKVDEPLNFCNDVVKNKNFDKFFLRYPNYLEQFHGIKEKDTYPKWMLVSNKNNKEDTILKSYVLGEFQGAFVGVGSEEDGVEDASLWNYAWDIEEVEDGAEETSKEVLCEGLNETAKVIYENNKQKGFWDEERNVGELLMLVTSELGEAMEAHRKGKFAQWENFEGHLEWKTEDFKTAFKENVKDTFEDEIADAVIRLLDMSAGLDIDLEKHINAKVKFNTMRPKLHGKKY